MNFQSPTQTLIWHVGLHKTGTTSFQNWLHQMSKDPSADFSTLEHLADAHQMVQSKFDNLEQFLTTVLGSERQYLLSTETTTHFIDKYSEEFFEIVDRINNAGIKIVFVLLLRRQEYLRESVVSEVVKTWYTGDLNAVGYLGWRFNGLLSSLFQTLKFRNELRVAVYRESRDSLPTQISLCGLTPDQNSHLRPRLNKSLSRQMTILLSRIPGHDAKQKVLREFLFIDTPVDHLPLFSPESRFELMQEALGDNIALKQYLSHEDFEYLTEIRASADHETWTPSPELVASDIDRVNKLLQKNGHPPISLTRHD